MMSPGDVGLTEDGQRGEDLIWGGVYVTRGGRLKLASCNAHPRFRNRTCIARAPIVNSAQS